jgi:hypothetical protein
MEVRTKVENFLAKAFLKIYVTIWSCTKLKDMLEVLPMLMFDNFVNQFVFIWGHEQCSKMSSEISPRSHYYLKDLKGMQYACHRLPYGEEDQTLLIDNEPSNAFWVPNWKLEWFFL